MIPPSDRYCAAVCRNGHVIRHDLDPPPQPSTSTGPPGFVEGSASLGPPPPPPSLPRSCSRCGAPVIQACTSCDAPLLGGIKLAMGLPGDLDRPDSFCWGCSEAYPWATREEPVDKRSGRSRATTPLRTVDTDRTATLLKERLEELSWLQDTGPEFETWRYKAQQTLRHALGDDHELVKTFESITWYEELSPGRPKAGGITGKDQGVGVLEAAIYEKEELAEPVDFASSASVDPELWAEVHHLVEQQKWAQVASQTAIFVESKIRQWAGLSDNVRTTHLMTEVLKPAGGIFRLGGNDAEAEGWHQFGRGFMGAVRNAATHRLQQRDDAKRYAMGVLGAGSLLLTQLRYEHGNRFKA